jgi:hypothetical protein
VRQFAVLLEPLQFFANFDLAVPGILVELMSFPRKDQQCIGNAPRCQSLFQQVVLALSFVKMPSDLRPFAISNILKALI